MPHLEDVPRVFFALASSGVFWLTTAILIRGPRPRASAAAGGAFILLVSAFLFLEAVSH